MKGVLLSLGKGRIGFQRKDVFYFFRRYGITVLLVTALLVGLISGSVCAGNADSSLVKGLDFLFMSDFQSRCSQSVLSAFSASLSSGFIFFMANMLLGLSVWGSVGVPFIIAFKGFGMGITGGFLYKSYGLTGVGFFLLVMLLGCVVSTLVLIYQGKLSISFANTLFSRVCGKTVRADETIYRYIVNNSFMLIALSLSSIADAVLNMLFAGVFAF